MKTETMIELLAQLLINVVLPLAKGDSKPLSLRVEQILPAKLKTSLAIEAAEAKAKSKLGG